MKHGGMQIILKGGVINGSKWVGVARLFERGMVGLKFLAASALAVAMLGLLTVRGGSRRATVLSDVSDSLLPCATCSSCAREASVDHR